MAGSVLSSANRVASVALYRGWCARETLVTSSSSSLPSLSSISTSSLELPTASVRRRSVVHGSMASLLLAISSPSIRAAENDFEDWYRFQGEGFALSVPPDFEDIREPEEFNDGSLYGNRAKPKTFAARFASPDRSELLGVVIRPSAELKLSFLAIKDVTDFGSLKEASRFFVPAGAKLYAARTVKSSEDSDRTYYYYEFATGENYIALEAGATGGKVYVLGVTAPRGKWRDDFKKLRLAATSFSVL